MINKKIAIGASLTVVIAVLVVAISLGAYLVTVTSETTSSSTATTTQSPSSTGLSSSSGTVSTSNQGTSSRTTTSGVSTTSAGPSTVTSTTSETQTTTSSVTSQAAPVCTIATPALIQTAFSNDSSTPDVVSLFQSYSRMGVYFSEVSTGTIFVSQTYTSYDTNVQGTSSATETYNVVYSSPTTYKVHIFENQSGVTLNATAWLLKDGTVVAYQYLGQNISGAEASGLVSGLMSPFFYQGEYTSLVQTLTSSTGLQAAASGSEKVGPTTVALTNYTASSVPLTVQICGGSLTLSAVSLQTGAVQGSNVGLLMSMTVSGNETYHSQTNQIVLLSYRLISLQSA